MAMPAAIGVVASRYGLRAGLSLLILSGAATVVVTRRAHVARPGTT
jgi:hypothetical protein